MFKKILIANRGEIVSRVIQTCKRLNIQSVAIYSEADKNASFVKEADEAFLVGSERIQDSYLNQENIIKIALDNKVDAIHPGYGLLSENSEFASLCAENNICFIGPKSEHIEKMADKIAARNFMREIDVPVVPGSHLSLNENDLDFVSDIGYPVMLKAAAGGGGVGLQLIHSEQELKKSFKQQSERAKSLFADGSLYIEKYIQNAKHIEVQVARDASGNAMHFYERECSVQRRNQKVIEEAPCQFISMQTREKLYQYSLKVIETLEYENLGTIEYLVDDKENIYFIEMNTRIQVEHPVTEEITKQDLVELQIRIAAKEDIAYSQKDIKYTGHSIEARVYAEDPTTFFPSPGKITQFSLPKSKTIRYDFLAEQDYIVTPFYDPLIGKVTSYGSTREEAIGELLTHLEKIEIGGIRTNIPMLIEVLKDPSFIDGRFNINFVNDVYLQKVQNK